MLTHKGTKTLTTERLILRRFLVSDSTDMYNNWANDERVTKYLTWQPHTSENATKDLLKIWCKEYTKPDYYQWAIEFDGKAIGSICVVRSSDKNECAELGYCIGCDFWNKGIMSEAVFRITDFLFREIGYNRISICHATKNAASGKVAQKCGYKFEGIERESFKSRSGEFLDIAKHSILKKEWKWCKRP